jgi:hypothetical protein
MAYKGAIEAIMSVKARRFTGTHGANYAIYY